ITKIIEDFYGNPKVLTRSKIERYIDLAQSEGARVSNVRRMLFIRRLMENGMLLDLSDIEIPTLIMWGESNKWASPEHASKWAEQMPNATLVTYPAYGHVLMEEG
ncbi:MAG: hypothetical protein CUN55_21275, partial [Phototrophicales bacterium]